MEKQDISSARRRLKCTNRKTRKRALKIIQQYNREKRNRTMALTNANMINS
ncbi:MULTISPECIES: putative metal homeostasis protein [unclassified Enterococcus]|uniref:putative metal homeostasis protein n=1 Tax=unclassified Enterococcus TaxID=2608891 RepID=UPI001CE15255|nr:MULTISPECIES: putative metal homeostasis protein [unclassified Enterococcus]MCA5011746.1 putative metal homeostasis protein [Enterococcus sp. S23]MCA5014812.1 putative metal homeostasis protein [Enterococcus sp. S22(2020)]